MLQTASIGVAVRECLNRPRQGVVQSVFERSAYIDFDGTLLCIGLSPIGRGPINILYDQQNHTLHSFLRPGVKVHYSPIENTLRINGIVIAQMSRARVYDNGANQIQLTTLSLNTHRACLARLPLPTEGLFPLLATSSTTTPASHLYTCNDAEIQTVQSIDLALRQFALPIISVLANWIRSVVRGDQIVPNPDKSICSLLGAGPGLTPSGDDLLAGVLLTLRITGYAGASEKLWGHLQPAIAKRTNLVSAALLQQSARGRAGEFALEAIAVYTAPERLDGKKLSDILASIGQTSGWDYFAGVLLVLDAVAETVEKTEVDLSNTNLVCNG